MLDKNYFLRLALRASSNPVEKSMAHVPIDAIFEERFAVEKDPESGTHYIIDDDVKKNVQKLRYRDPIFYARFKSSALEPSLEKASLIKYQDMDRVFHVTPAEHVPWRVKAQMMTGNVFFLPPAKGRGTGDFLIESNRKVVPSDFKDGTFSFSDAESYFVRQKLPGLYIYDLLQFPIKG